jgi:hypothetical protein
VVDAIPPLALAQQQCLQPPTDHGALFVGTFTEQFMIYVFLGELAGSSKTMSIIRGGPVETVER